jgi:signal transduction histidine kinase
MTCKRTTALLVLLIGLGSEARSFETPVGDARPAVPSRRVLVLNEVNASYPAISVIDEALRESFQGSKYQIDIYREYMESSLFPDEADQKVIRDSIIRKYQGSRRPDVIITVGSSPLRFMLEEHGKHFAGIPVIFCVSSGVESALKQDPDFTGVTTGIKAAETLEAALQVLPDTDSLVVVGGTGLFDRRLVQAVKAQLEGQSSRLKISYLTDLTTPELLNRLHNLPKNSVVLYTSLSRDAAGVHYSSREICPLIISASNVPVFTLFDLNFGHGEVGGEISAVRSQGTIAGKAALQVLDGVRAGNIPIAEASTEFIFDARALQRWSISERRLPAGARVLFREPTMWERYKSYILMALLLLLLESGLILALLIQRARRRKAEKQILEAQKELKGSYYRIRELGERLFKAHEAERARIGRELHDGICQQLSILASKLQLADQSAENRTGAFVEEAQEIATNVRDLSHQLHPARLRLAGLVAAIAGFQSTYPNAAIDFTHENVPETLPDDLALSLYRIVQEALQNSVRHGHARHVRIRLSRQRGELVLELSDDGTGFDPLTSRESGLGLLSMQERVELFGGSFHLASDPQSGTSLRVTVPLPNGSAAEGG